MPTRVEATDRGDDPARRFEVLISRQEAACRDLEALADTLPERLDTLAATILAGGLSGLLRSCQAIEEARVFPALLERDPGFEPMIERLRAEHMEDEDHAVVLADAVATCVRDPRRADADRLGYLMRGMFQPLRRHTAFDRHVVLRLYRRRS